MSRRSNINMLEGPLFSNVIAYTVPIILTSLLQLLFNAADLVVVGRFCGSASVGAVGATSSLTNLMVNFFIGISVGTGVTVAQAIGARDNKLVHQTVHTAIPTALISGAFLTIVGIAFCETFLKLMGTPDDILPLSAVYMRIYFGGIVFTLVYNFCAAILRAAGDTKTPLTALSIAGVLNVILNLIFVTLFDMNVAGVALATIISQALSAVLVIIALMRREDGCSLSFHNLRIYKDPLLKILRIGIPTGIQSSLFSISNVLIQSSVNSFGAVSTSGNAAASNIEGFVYVIMNSFQQTALNFIGQNTGAKNYSRIRKIYWTCLLCVFVSGAISGSLAFGFGEQLLSIYITDSADAVAHGLTRLSFICLPYAIAGLMDVTSGALRGIGSAVAPMVVCIVGVCVFRVAWIYTIFQHFHTPECLFSSYPISWGLVLITELIMFFVLLKKKEKRENNTL